MLKHIMKRIIKTAILYIAGSLIGFAFCTIIDDTIFETVPSIRLYILIMFIATIAIEGLFSYIDYKGGHKNG